MGHPKSGGLRQPTCSPYPRAAPAFKPDVQYVPPKILRIHRARFGNPIDPQKITN